MNEDWFNKDIDQAASAFNRSRRALRNARPTKMTEAELVEKFSGDDENSWTHVMDFLFPWRKNKKLRIIEPTGNSDNLALIARLEQKMKEKPGQAEYIQAQINELRNR